MMNFQDLSLWALVCVFLAAAGVIAYAGTRIARIADTLADRTGMGEVIAGAVFVGASTSLSGAVMSAATAFAGAPGIAIGNTLGGITAQTAFIAVADLVYRRANLEHAAATVTGLAQGVLLVTLLTMPLLAAVYPPITIWGIHPVSILILVSYGLGVQLLGRIRDEPMWRPVMTDETQREQADSQSAADERSTPSLWASFALYAGLTALCGYVIGRAAIALAARTGLSESAVGTVFTAVTTSLPELVVAISAVRMGALSLAVGNVIGGNAFDVLFLSFADLFYDGSIYSAFKATDYGSALIAILMTGVLLLGMLRRERIGIARIGFESVIVLALYAGVVILAFVASD